MPRRIIAFLIALYAIAFAFGAMAAIRWPSLMMVAGLVVEPESLSGVNEVNWRELGIAYGAPYFLAALCFYASALALGRRKKDAMLWYLMGCFAGFPCVFLVDFEPGWWTDPSTGEGAVAGAALAAILLAIAVRMLTTGPRRRIKTPPQTAQAEPDMADIAQPETPQTLVTVAPAAQSKPRRRRPVPAAIARQRAFLAAEGRRQRAKQQRR